MAKPLLLEDAPAVMIELGFEFAAMAGPCEVRLAGTDETAMHAAAAAAIGEVRRIERKYSRYLEDSDVSRINAAAGSGRATTVDDETAALLDFAAQVHDATDGRFDITSGVLRRAWDFRSGQLPSAGQVEALLPLIGWTQVGWSRPAVLLPRAGMELDFGGFGKEYAADRAAAVLWQHAMRGGYVNLGGDLRVVGPRGDGSPWRLGIRHPRQRDALLAEIELACGALATSGDYERFIEVDGKRYAHLLDPRSGWPVPGGWRSVSVVAPTCVAAGTVCTAALLAGDDAHGYLERQGVWYLGVDAEGRPRASSTRSASP